MLSSAVSLVLALVTSSDSSDLSQRELEAWKKVQPAVVFLLDGKTIRGAAALISKEGYFLAHATAVKGKEVSARTNDGNTIKMDWIASDEPTQLVLLKADEWTSTASPVAISSTSAGNKGMLAITPSGPVRAERAGETYGIVNPSRRVVKLDEIRLENNLPSLGGSLLFTMNGELAGAINAALGMSPSQNVQKIRANGDLVGGNGGARLGPEKSLQQYGPGVLTAAYTVGPKVFNRVVAGFLSPDHTVKHPAIGIFCRDAVTQTGALIDSVTKGSPADLAGLQKDDVIYAIENQAVKTQIDFARIMADQEIGDHIRVWVRRGGLQQMVTVEVGS